MQNRWRKVLSLGLIFNYPSPPTHTIHADWEWPRKINMLTHPCPHRTMVMIVACSFLDVTKMYFNTSSYRSRSCIQTEKHFTSRIATEILKDWDHYPSDSVSCLVHNPLQHDYYDHFPSDLGTFYSPSHHVEKIVKLT